MKGDLLGPWLVTMVELTQRRVAPSRGAATQHFDTLIPAARAAETTGVFVRAPVRVIAGRRMCTEARSVRRLLVLAATISLALAGTASTAAAASTKAEFIRRGDALCTGMAKQLAPLRRRAEAAYALPESRRMAAVAAIWSDQIRIQVTFNHRLRAIGAPPDDAAARGLLAQLDRGVVLARRIQSAFADGRIASLSSALPAYLEFTLKLNRHVRAYGFRVCGH